jgi:hypothetical protein
MPMATIQSCSVVREHVRHPMSETRVSTSETRDALGASPPFVRPLVRVDAGGRVAAFVRKQQPEAAAETPTCDPSAPAPVGLHRDSGSGRGWCTCRCRVAELTALGGAHGRADRTQPEDAEAALRR